MVIGSIEASLDRARSAILDEPDVGRLWPRCCESMSTPVEKKCQTRSISVCVDIHRRSSEMEALAERSLSMYRL